MRRLLVLLSLASLAIAGVGSLGLVACGGNDKPPLMPDSVDMPTEGPEAGAPALAPGTK